MIYKRINARCQKNSKVLIISIAVHLLILVIIIPNSIEKTPDKEVWNFIPAPKKASKLPKINRTISLRKPEKVQSLVARIPTIAAYSPLEKRIVNLPEFKREALFSENASLNVLNNQLPSIEIIQTVLPSVSMLFGQEIGTQKLGVIWDVSKSMHPYLREVFFEIQENFPQACLILISGSGISPQITGQIYPIQQRKCFQESKVQKHFQQSTDSQSLKMLETFLKRPNTYHINASLDQASHIAFKKLIREEIKAIYWFGDFRDPIDTRYLQTLSDELKSKQTTVYLHHPKGIVTGEKTIDRVEAICKILIYPSGGSQIKKPLFQPKI